MQFKKDIKNLFQSLDNIIKLNVEVYQFSFYYHNHVIFEPMEAKLYDKKVTMLKQQIIAEYSQESFLYPLEKNAFVLSSSFHPETMGSVIWSSRNAKDILEMDEKLLNSLHINSLMPKVVSSVHDDFIGHYLKTANSKLVNNYRDLWALTYKKKLLSVKSCLKLYMDDSSLNFISYIRKITDKVALIVDNFGEIDSFGENFFKMTGLEFDFCINYTNISIFTFMPQMIVQFLGHFYDLPDFRVNGFPYEFLDETFVVIFKEMNHKVLDLSKQLKAAKERKDEYALCLFQYLSGLEFTDIDKVYRVKLKTSRLSFEKADFVHSFWELKFMDYMDVTDKFTYEHYTQQRCFLEKIKIDRSMKQSIESYAERMAENAVENPMDTGSEREFMKKSSISTPIKKASKLNNRKSVIMVAKDEDSENESFVKESRSNNPNSQYSSPKSRRLKE